MKIREAYLDYRYAIVGLSKQTQRDYIQKLGVFVDWTEQEGLLLETLVSKDIRRFIENVKGHINAQGKPIASVTVKGYVIVLKTFLAWLTAEEDYSKVVSSKLASRIELPRVESKVIEVFTPAQVKALLVACEQEMDDTLTVRDKAIVSVLFDSGIRASELVSLTVDCCFMEPNDSYLKVHGKGNKWREVPLGRQASTALRRYITRYRHAHRGVQTVFLSRHHEPMTVSGLDQIIARLGQWAHIRGVRCSPHTFRHSYSVNYLQASGDVYKLSRSLGHTSVKVTEVYLRAVSSRQARSGISVLDLMG